MRFTFAALAPLVSALAIRGHSGSGSGPKEIDHEVVFDPPSDYNTPRVLYARSVELPNNDLLLTWENYSPEPPPVYFPIFKSTDSGESWTHISNVTDQAYHFGNRYQPFLYVLPQQIGAFPKDTLLLAGNAIPTDLSSTHLVLYASFDSGYTWKFISHIANGGEAEPDDGLTPIWEPFLMVYNNQLICYYSDQRMNATYGQYLVHQVTSDLYNWGPVVPDVEWGTYTDRPGMTTVTHLPNGEYMMTYEYGGYHGTSTYSFPVHYRISANPEKFNEAPDYALVTTDGTVPAGSPYVTWSSYGGKNGTIIVSSGCCSNIFVNQALADVNSWVSVAVPETISYTRSLRVFQEDPKYLLIAGGGALGVNNEVTISVVDLADLSL